MKTNVLVTGTGRNSHMDHMTWYELVILRPWLFFERLWNQRKRLLWNGIDKQAYWKRFWSHSFRVRSIWIMYKAGLIRTSTSCGGQMQGSPFWSGQVYEHLNPHYKGIRRVSSFNHPLPCPYLERFKDLIKPTADSLHPKCKFIQGNITELKSLEQAFENSKCKLGSFCLQNLS